MFRSMHARSRRSQSPTDFLASVHNPQHDLKRAPSGCSRLSPDRPEVMKLP
jgi:hypothetical protein